MVKKKRVLFLCTHNANRSQMAEGILNALHGARYSAFSAGSTPSVVNPYAKKVLAEVGIDISSHRSKSIDEFKARQFDYVVTVCDRAKEACPFFPEAGEYVHKSFDDPAALEGDETSVLAGFRRVRDEIRDWINGFFGDDKKNAK